MAVGNFIWGDGGVQLTPEAIAAQRKVAQAMMQRGGDYSPVQSAWQGAARVAEGLSGGLDAYTADAAEKRNATAERELLASLITGGGVPAPVTAPAAAASPVSIPAAPARNVSPGKIYSNDEPSPLDPPSGQDRDLAIRTIVGEAANQGPVGMNAVASVIRNRAVSGQYGGDTPSGVVMSPNQFEPWNGGKARERMLALKPTDPAYVAAGRAVDQAYAGNDPTNGAVNFIEPKLQTALGRPMPAWAQAPGVMIGDHKFIGGAPQQPGQVASADPAALPPAAAPAEGFAVPGQPSPAVQTVAQAMPQAGVNPRMLQALASPYVSDGTKKVLGIMLQNQLSSDAVTQVDLGNKVGIMDKRGNILRTIDKGEPNKGPEYGVLRKDEFGNEVYGWRDPRDKSIAETKPPVAAVPAQPSAIPPAPPGVDPKVWRETFSKNAAAGATPGSFDDTAKMRHEFTQLPSYKNMSQAAPIYQSMHEAAGRNTKAADLNLVYGLGKIMDPGSVVREGEIQMANNAQGWQEKLNGIIAQINGQGGLTPEGRQALMAEAYGRINSYKAEFDRDAGRYKGITERNRIPTADVIPEFGEFKPWTIPKTEATTPPAIDDLVKKYSK